MREQYMTKFILSLVKSAIQEEVSFNEDCSVIEWEQVYKIAKKNALVSLLYDPIKMLAGEYKIPEALMVKWKNYAMISMISESEKYRGLRKILDIAKEQDITIILFKGCVLADIYPKYLSRVSCDTDMFVYQRDREKIIKILEGLGYRKDEQNTKEMVLVYVLDLIHHEVELHFSLWEDYKGTKIDLIDNMNLVKEESLIQINACGMEVTTLGYQEHLVFQMFHIIKHFSLQGVSIRYLIDVTLYLNRHEEYINFEEFWNKMEILSYDKFCENFFHICVQYLKMSPKILAGRKIKIAEDTEEFMTDLINVGFIYDEKKVGWQLLGTITPYFIGEQEIPKSRFRLQIQIIFPASKNLPTEYAYAIKHKILLPVAWIHRWGYFLIKRNKHKADWYNAKEMVAVAEHRLSLMRNLGLMDGGKK